MNLRVGCASLARARRPALHDLRASLVMLSLLARVRVVTNDVTCPLPAGLEPPRDVSHASFVESVLGPRVEPSVLTLRVVAKASRELLDPIRARRVQVHGQRDLTDVLPKRVVLCAKPFRALDAHHAW